MMSPLSPPGREAVYPNPWWFWYWDIRVYFMLVAWPPTMQISVFNRWCIRKVLRLTMRCLEEACGTKMMYLSLLHIKIERNIYTWAKKPLSICSDSLLSEHRVGVPRLPSLPFASCLAPTGFRSCLSLLAGSYTGWAWELWSFRCYPSAS